MSIQMTKKGTLPAEKWYTGWCTKCMSEYRAQRKDLNYESDYRESSYTATCLLTGCGNTVYFAQEK